jgi:membrane protein implicated in regulation of membrane protease activity
MSETDWLRLAALLMAALLILPAALRLPWFSRRVLLFVAIWLGIFAAIGLGWQLLH